MATRARLRGSVFVSCGEGKGLRAAIDRPLVELAASKVTTGFDAQNEIIC